MSEEKPSVWIVLVSLLMLFVSGAWSLASLIPCVRCEILWLLIFHLVTVSNILFLVSLLLPMMIDLEMGAKEDLKRRMILAFSIYVLALIISIVLFTASFIMMPLPRHIALGPD